MTLSESIAWSFARSIIIASVALWPLRTVLQTIGRRATVRARRFWILLAIFPFFVPELLIGFHYRLTATQLSFGTSPVVAAICTEFLYGVLQLARCLAVGVAVSLLLPATSVTQESLHSWELLRTTLRPSEWQRGWLALRVHGPWNALLISWSLMALIAFQEFETAALMQIDRHPVAWSVWLFDAHAARQPLLESVRMIFIPMLWELLLLAPAMLLYRHSFEQIRSSSKLSLATTSAIQMPQDDCRSGRRPGGGVLASFFLAPAIVLFLFWPLLSNATATASGLVSMLANHVNRNQAVRQILTSAGFATAATIVAMNLVAFIFPKQQRRSVRERSTMQWTQRLIIGLVVIGLAGSLVLSVLLVAVFQLPMLRPLYDTWLPMLLGQAIAVLPKALAIGLLLQQAKDGPGIHSALLLLKSPAVETRRRAAKTLWRLTTSRWLLGGLVVAHWCFWDVTVASILRPVALEPVVTRLYNEMHYGRTEALMSLTVLAALTPVAVWLMAMIASFLKAGWQAHGTSGA